MTKKIITKQKALAKGLAERSSLITCPTFFILTVANNTRTEIYEEIFNYINNDFCNYFDKL